MTAGRRIASSAAALLLAAASRGAAAPRPPNLPEALLAENPDEVHAGGANLRKQIENMRIHGVSPVVCINAFPTDHPSEHAAIKEIAESMGARAAVSTHFADGGRGAAELAEAVAEALAADRDHAIRAVAVVHNETSTGVASDIAALRRAIDATGHPALLLVDTISSLASMDHRHDEWGVDVTVGGSQKGLMLPPGLSFNALSPKALAASETSRSPRSFWAWDEMLKANRDGFFPYTPSTNLLQGLRVALDLLAAEGLDAVFARHRRAAAATRAAVAAWGLELQCADPSACSSSLTAVRMPEGWSADALRADILARSDMSLGNGLGPLADRVFRIGHLGDFNDLAVLATLSGVEMGLRGAGIPIGAGGLDAAMVALGSVALGGNGGPAAA